MENYFSSRITISEIRDKIGAPSVLRIQRLNGLTISDIPLADLPGSGNSTYDPTVFGELTMHVASNNDYTGAFYIQDPTITKTGISVPPTGTIGYFAKDVIPDGWLEIGFESDYFTYQRQIGGTWDNPVYANTEYAEIYQLLDDWGLVKSTDRVAGLGKRFNTIDPFKGYFIRSLNPSNSGVNNSKNIFDTEISYLSIHKHDGDTLYQTHTGGIIDRGKIAKIGSYNTEFWFNYKWRAGFNWDVENNGTIRINSGLSSEWPNPTSPQKYVTDFDNHIHGRIQTYYRGHDGLYGRISPTYVEYSGGGSIANDSDNQIYLEQSDFTSGDQNNTTSNLTFYTPFSDSGRPSYTYYTGYGNVYRSTAWLTQTYRVVSEQTYTVASTSSRNLTLDYTLGKANPQNKQTYTNTSFNQQTYTVHNTNIPDYQNVTAQQTLSGITYNTPSLNYTAVKTTRSDARYWPYHILKAPTGTPSGSEPYNSGDYGPLADVSSAAGDHSHSYATTSTMSRGIYNENRPENIALRMCIKY